MKFAFLMLFLLTVPAGCDDSVGEVFIALQSDFADFRDWQMTALGDEPLTGHPAGQRTAFVKTPLPIGSPSFPIGEIIVKTVQVTPDDETTWDLFGMVKRGGDYNSDGARNWEFFLMDIPSTGAAPNISARGSDPTGGANAHAAYMDASGNNIACNSCHGAPGAEQTDYVLTPQLQPGGDGGT